MLCSGLQVHLLLLGLQFAVCWFETRALPPEPAVRWHQQSTETTGAVASTAEQLAVNHQPAGDKASQTTFFSWNQNSRRFKTNDSLSESEVNISQPHHNVNTTIIKQDRGLESLRDIQAGDKNTGISPPVSLEDNDNSAKTAAAVIIVVGIVVLVGLMHFKVWAEIRGRFSYCHHAKHDSLSQSNPDDGVLANPQAAAREDGLLNLNPRSWVESFRTRALCVIHKVVNGIRERTVIVPSRESVRVPLRESGAEVHS